MSGLRIALTAPSLAPGFGGPAAKARALATSLRALGHSVELLAAEAPSEAGVTPLRSVAHFHGTPVPLDLYRVVSAVRAAQLVHIIGYRDPTGTVAALAARAAGVPYLLEPAGMHRRRLRSITLKRVFDETVGRPVVRHARLVVATSALESAELIADGVPPGRVVVRPNGVDLVALRPARSRGALRNAIGVPAGAPLILALGRITGKKGLRPLVAAMTDLPQAHLLVAGPDGGDGTLAAVMADRVRLALESRVHVRDGLWGAERAQAFCDADLFCLYSQAENFGAAALEAAAAGVAVVVSDQCGAAEWLGAGSVVVPIGRDDALRDTLRRLTTDGAERRRVAEAGRLAAAALTWDAVAARQARIYAEALR